MLPVSVTEAVMISWTSIQKRPSRALGEQRSLLQDPPNVCDRHELSDLLPDTDYEFHLRLESQAGAGASPSVTPGVESRN